MSVKPENTELGTAAEKHFAENNPDWLWLNAVKDRRFRKDFVSMYHPDVGLDVQTTEYGNGEIRLYDYKIIVDNRDHPGVPPVKLFMFYRILEPVGWICWNDVVYALIKDELDRGEFFWRIPEKLLTGGFPPA